MIMIEQKCDDEIKKDNDELSVGDDLEVYISLAANLHYPTVLVGSGGKIIYKNSKAANRCRKWRVGSNLKAYVENLDYKSIMGVKIGDYTVFSNGGDSILVLRFDDFYFLMFVLEFERNVAHFDSLYNYISSIPENNFFANRKLVPKKAMSPEKQKECEAFASKFEYFYKEVEFCVESPKFLYFKQAAKKEHDIIELLARMTEYINSRNLPFSCKFNIKNRENFYVDCTSKDVAAIFAILIFLALQCSDSKKPIVKLDLAKTEKQNFFYITVSTKSSMTEEALQEYLLKDEVSNKMGLYFQTVKVLSSKHFWGLDVSKNGDYIEFSVSIFSTQPKDVWFHDSLLLSASEVLDEFEKFFELLLDIM